MTKQSKRIDTACFLIILVILVLAACAFFGRGRMTSARELASTYRYVGDVIW